MTPASDAYDVVVIGAGAGGMTAAAVAAAEGLSVLRDREDRVCRRDHGVVGRHDLDPGQRPNEAGRFVLTARPMPPIISPAPSPSLTMPTCGTSFFRAARRRSIISRRNTEVRLQPVEGISRLLSGVCRAPRPGGRVLEPVTFDGAQARTNCSAAAPAAAGIHPVRRHDGATGFVHSAPSSSSARSLRSTLALAAA